MTGTSGVGSDCSSNWATPLPPKNCLMFVLRYGVIQELLSSSYYLGQLGTDYNDILLNWQAQKYATRVAFHSDWMITVKAFFLLLPHRASRWSVGPIARIKSTQCSSHRRLIPTEEFSPKGFKSFLTHPIYLLTWVHRRLNELAVLR